MEISKLDETEEWIDVPLDEPKDYGSDIEVGLKDTEKSAPFFASFFFHIFFFRLFFASFFFHFFHLSFQVLAIHSGGIPRDADDSCRASNKYIR